MAIPQFEVDMDIIAKLGEYPGSDDGLTPAGFKAKFDLAGKFIKQYINTILLPELNNIVDVQALLDNILDETLTKADKAAPAKYVGDVIRSLNAQFNIEQAIYFEKTVRNGDYVLNTDQQFRANIVDSENIRILGGEAVTQGHIMSLNVGGNQVLSISPGIYGVYRNDLICARFRRYSDGTEDNSLVVVEGVQNQTGGVDPECYTDNINVMGAVTYDFPLYRVKVTGVDVTLEQLFKVQKSLTETIAESVIDSLNRWEGGSY
jgi:hypothetical protein